MYAMGGNPLFALAVLGWPIDTIPVSAAQEVMAGARAVCAEAGIVMAGGHSIDSKDPIFGLVVNGMVAIDNLKRNNSAKTGDILLLTKPLGVGILATAQKKELIEADDLDLLVKQLTTLNKVGAQLGKIKGVHAMTDVTGFGLLGHLIEMAEGSGMSAQINFGSVPLISDRLIEYVELGSVPGGTNRNWDSYGHKVQFHNGENQLLQKNILADPQTSGGLLIAVAKDAINEAIEALKQNGLSDRVTPIGEITEAGNFAVSVS